MLRLTSTILVVLVTLGLLIPVDARAFTSLPSGFTDVPITDVPVPTAIAWLPGGTLLIASQIGTLFRWTNGTGLQPSLDLTSAVCSNGEMGLLGVAVDPNFDAGQRFIYLYYTHKQGPDCTVAADRANRVSRFTLDGSNNAGEEFVLIDHVPAPGSNHNAGDLHFGLDGLLYISVGDGGVDLQTGGGGALNGNARRLDLLNGKILRITPDGGIPAGNPFQGGGTTQCAATGQAQSQSHRTDSHGKARTKSKHGHKHKQTHHREQKRRHRHKRRSQNDNPPPQDQPIPNPNPSGPICQEIFAGTLDGHPLISNRSVWRNFPWVWNEHWSFRNMVLIGDALHTAHFSIGSGTRLAIEDAIALAKALDAEPSLSDGLARYQAERQPIVKKLVTAARTSADWYESFPAHMKLDPVDFAYSYITRSGRIDDDRLRAMAPQFMARYDASRETGTRA